MRIHARGSWGRDAAPRGVLAGTALLVASGCATSFSLPAFIEPNVPHRIAERDVDVPNAVRLERLPPGARVAIEEGGGKRRVVATRAEGALELPLVFRRHEHVDNGVATRSPGPGIDVSIQAKGAMPRLLHVTEKTGALDAHLDGAPLPYVEVPPSISADVDVALDRLASGRCAEATSRLRRAPRGAPGVTAALAARLDGLPRAGAARAPR